MCKLQQKTKTKKERKLYGGRPSVKSIYLYSFKVSQNTATPPQFKARHKLMLTKEIFSVDSRSLGH